MTDLLNRLWELLSYNPETGWFTNRHDRGPAARGKRAGSPTGHGYRKITIDCMKFYEHHLAWLYCHGEWPEELDHRNGIRDDNRISNLRLATRTQNCFNSKKYTGQSGLSGAYLDRRNSQWYSKIQVGGQQKFLGNFNTAREAHEAYMAALNHYGGEYAFHNRHGRGH